ncbi:MAG: NADH-quinone oxidoreductase subunit I [Deltaproteobacteria bacterium]|nr:NADH-quinone oxidoreductase subunit I [Deltaproteobacteria bacterium]
MIIKVRERTKMSAYERLYLPEVFRGLGVTLKHLFHNLFGNHKTRPLQTVRYPEQKLNYPERFRGQHRLLRRDNGSTRCVACYLCATACPAYCIHIVAGEAKDPKIEKYPTSFTIDMLRCIYCGLCVEACPEDAIRMDTGIHTKPFLARSDAVMGHLELLAFPGQKDTSLPYGAQEYRVLKNTEKI